MILFLGLCGVSRLEEGVGWSATKNKEKECEQNAKSERYTERSTAIHTRPATG